MFIQTEELRDPSALRFMPGVPVLRSGGTLVFDDAARATRSPLAQRLLEIDYIRKVEFGADHIDLTKSDDRDWKQIKPAVLGAIMDHFLSKTPVVIDDGREDAPAPADDPTTRKIVELLETRIRPVARDQGGDIEFRGFEDGRVILEFTGGAFALKGGVQTMLRHYIPEVGEVVNYLDTVPKPGLDTPAGRAIRQVLDDEVNPQVAMHGGHITLLDLIEDTAYIRLEGGCQGCAMSAMTLKQGVEGAIRRVAPEVIHVLDATDHADGKNPYYQPGHHGA
jgi:Fe-S cluster biogenesis protein NfuA